MAPPPVEVCNRPEAADTLSGKANDHPSANALENLARAVLRLLDDGRDDVAAIVQISLALDTPKLRALLGSGQEDADAPWKHMKSERYNRRHGKAISPEKGVLYTLVVLEACSVFAHVAKDYWKYNRADVEVNRTGVRSRVSSPRDIQRSENLSAFADRAAPMVFANLDAWEDYIKGLESCGTETVELAVPLERLSSREMLRAVGGFVEELVEHDSEIARSNGSQKRKPDELANEIVRHRRIHDPNDVNWMADRWDAVRDMVDRSLAAGNLDVLGRTGPILTHFSYVFEGGRPQNERLRMKIAECLQAQRSDVPPDVALFEAIEGQGFISLQGDDFANLNLVAGDEAYRENEAKIRETIKSLEHQNRDPRLALETCATLYRLRAHVLVNKKQHTNAELLFRRAAAQAAMANNESLQCAVLIDGARSALAHPNRVAKIRAFEDQIKAAEALAWQDGTRPNWLRLVEMHLALAEVYAGVNQHDDALPNLNKAEYFWRSAQPKGTKLNYQIELLGRIKAARAMLAGARSSRR